MNVRTGLALVALFSLLGAGCASAGTGGGGGGSGAAPQRAAGARPTPRGERLEVGIRPRDNQHTRSAELYLAQALAANDEAQKQARFRQALEAALAGIAADPQNPKSYYQAGQAYVGLNDFLGADSMLTKAEELHPVYILETEAWREQGWVAAYNKALEPLNAGNLEEALKLFEEAEALYSVRPEAQLQLGSLYSRLNRPDDAVRAFREAMRRLEETKAREMGDTATAEIWQQHWNFARISLGQVLILAQRYEEAAEYLGSLLAENPDDIEILGSLASVLSELGKADSVQALYDRLLNRPGLSERDYFNAGVGLYQIENYAMAAEAFKKAAELNPFNRDARLNLLQTHYAAENWSEVIPAAQAVLEVDPRNGTVWIILTRAFSEMGRVEEANETFRQYEAMGYEIQNLSLEPGLEGGATVRGELKNNSLAPGTPITLRFRFGGQGGREVGTLEVTVEAPEAEGVRSFTGTFRSSQTVTGYRYEVIGR